jgi:hypothetical protein
MESTARPIVVVPTTGFRLIPHGIGGMIIAIYLAVVARLVLQGQSLEQAVRFYWFFPLFMLPFFFLFLITEVTRVEVSPLGVRFVFFPMVPVFYQWQDVDSLVGPDFLGVLSVVGTPETRGRSTAIRIQPSQAKAILTHPSCPARLHSPRVVTALGLGIVGNEGD